MTRPTQSLDRGDLKDPDRSRRTILHLLTTWAEQTPEAIALLAPDRDPLTYAGLLSQVENTMQTLRAMGVGRHDRVAIALPNGPEMAVAFLGISSAATSAPLNPAYGAREFAFYLSDLNAKALVVQSDLDTPARAAAQDFNIPIVELSINSEAEAGALSLAWDGDANAPRAGLTEPVDGADVALVLHTSGTTSRPKIVPLTHANLLASAYNIQVAYELTSADCCLNVMPLFHIHGLVAAILSTLVAGASVVCTPGFDASCFFDWLAEYHPTWYTAVPTMHQAILKRAEAHHQAIARCPLRFIRSCSASLPPMVMAELEQVFQVPVLEAYGMTEAAHQMTSNPLPPRQRKAGSVGVPTGPEVAIMDEAGDLLKRGETGEIVIRGANVTRGYENNAEANRSAFVHGWFRTGDQGLLDEDGYLKITGRIKEIINRGGEKVAPREVDEALLEHAAVAQAVAFAVPHATLGEDVAAAVVFQEGASATEWELRQAAFARLADFKVPSQIVIVDEIPKGPTGKLQRIGLAEQLAQELEAPYASPRNALERKLADIWIEVLGCDQVGIYDNFFGLGGDSLAATRAMDRTREVLQRELPLTLIFQAPTIEQFAGMLARQGRAVAQGSLVLLRSGGPKPPIFCLPGVLRNVFPAFNRLAQSLGSERPVYALQDSLYNPTKVETKVRGYLGEIVEVQPEGPYLLLGECSGAILAFELAQQMRTRGQNVALLALLEPTTPSTPGLRATYNWGHSAWTRVKRRFRHHTRSMAQITSAERGVYLHFRWKAMANQWALSRYHPRPYPGRIDLFLTADSLQPGSDPRKEWHAYAEGGLEVHEIPGARATIIGTESASPTKEQARSLADYLQARIADALTNG